MAGSRSAESDPDRAAEPRGARPAEGDLVPAEEPRRTGRVEYEGRTLELSVTAAGRLSLNACFEQGEVADGAWFGGLEIDAERPVRLGRCRFLAEDGRARSSRGRLLFVDDVYDCRSLVHDGKCVDLRGTFQNLPLVIAQRDRIRTDFKEYCANLAYDLSVYKRFFDEQDRNIEGERADVAESARDALRRSEGQHLMRFLDAKLEELAGLVRGFGADEHQHHGFFLRRTLWPYISSSRFLRHTNLKPRGYAGDAEAMLMAYENAFVGDGLFNQILHKHPLETAAAEAVRGRRDLVVRTLRDVFARFSGLPRNGFRFLSLACGPASELKEVFQERADLDRFGCALLDQDPDALEMARGTIQSIERSHGGRVEARYVRESVRTMLHMRRLSDHLGRFHYVYSMGLFDYLTAPVARAVLARVFGLVEPGGTLIVGNYHVDNETRLYMDYWMDWPLFYRTEESFLDLAKDLPAENVSIEFDDTRCQMFLRLDRGEEPAR